MQHSKRTHTLSVIIPAVSLFLLLFLFLLSGLISLGQQITLVSPHSCMAVRTNCSCMFGYRYYMAYLKCLEAPNLFDVYACYRDGRARFYWCRKLTDNLKKNTELTNEETAQLEDFLKQGNQADDLLIDFLQKNSLLS